ncbi:unnamed protein product [Linum trigynum]|uniref:Uncharacterized protein n=1 Tax=Linum trigynum TaxID=586398 RepID=A0AAV2CXH9_9ROSI
MRKGEGSGEVVTSRRWERDGGDRSWREARGLRRREPYGAAVVGGGGRDGWAGGRRWQREGEMAVVATEGRDDDGGDGRERQRAVRVLGRGKREDEFF